jgi:hypothetical protein
MSGIVQSDRPVMAPARLLGRPFGPEALASVRLLAAESLPRTRSEIARRFCERLEWVNRSGKPALINARVALVRLHRAGLLDLPAPKDWNGNRSGAALEVSAALDRALWEGSVEQVQPIFLEPVTSQQQSRLWNGIIVEHHYLGQAKLAGAQIRYLIYARKRIVGALGFGAAAWQVAARDRFIGWSTEQREANLHWVLNHARLLILPWIRIKNLASNILSRAVQRLPGDFRTRYGWAPVLLETFVESQRFAALSYKAAHWIYLGQTQGRGKKGAHPFPGKTQLPPKQVWVYPLDPHFRARLCAQPLAESIR